ncbi:MAG: hypothetical protein P8J45_01110, partial [Phycisphaerales bacterium]|nr:hypothetical protein [Phycisphaerales bacterium]
VADIDSDDDGIPDCSDSCPFWPGDCSEDGQTLFVVEGDSIQQAIDGVPAGGIVSVDAGIYTGSGSSVVTLPGRAFTLVGSAGAADTIIDGENQRRGLSAEGTGNDGVVIDALTFRNGRSIDGAGASFRSCTPEIRNCIFMDNSATNPGLGGGLFFNAVGDALVTNCQFIRNSAYGYGGGVLSSEGSSPSITGCLFDSNSVTGSTNEGYGGGLHCSNSAGLGTAGPTVQDCVFVDNSADPAGGGGVSAWPNVDITINDSSFTGNSALSGGGVWASDNSSPILRRCQFIENDSTGTSSGGGGGFYGSQCAQVMIDDCTFTENTFQHGGGGLYIKDTDDVDIINSTFDGNTVDPATPGQNGGGMLIWNGDFLIENCMFTGNTAACGGGIYAYTSNEVTAVQIRSCTITGNSAIFGAGLYSTESYAGNTSVFDSTICGNTPDQIFPVTGHEDNGNNCISDICDSDSDGTLDCIDGCPDDPEKIEPGACGCGVEELDTDGDGIPDCIDPCPDWPYGCSEDGSTLFVVVGQSIQSAIDLVPAGGTVELGAGVFAQGALDPVGKALTLRGATDIDGALATTIDAQGSGSVFVFQSGEGLDTELRNLVLTGGSATYGGGIECSNGSSPSIIDCMIIGNTASEYGGGINCYLDCAPLIERCAFIGNSATLAGGGISCDQSAPRILGCMIQGNDSALGGGVYSLRSADTEIGGSSICGNTTDQVNGAFEDAGDNCILEICGTDLDDNGVPDACDPDCDGDGEPDAWEISSGQAADCNENLVPDACEIDAGSVEDCNGNGIPDGCDVASGAEDDANDNGIPDTCDLVRGDLNLDGCIDGADLAQLLSLWGLPNPPIGDLNGDLVIDGLDLGTLLANWSLCP